MSNMVLEKIIAEYIDSLSYVKSIDGFLVKTTTLVIELEDLCRDNTCSVEEYLYKVLTDQRVEKYLKSYACYLDNIVDAVKRDPRHKKIRKYLDILVKALSSYECRPGYGMEISVETPSALWVKEYREKEIPVSTKKPLLKSRIRRLSAEEMIISMFYASIILFIIYLILNVF